MGHSSNSTLTIATDGAGAVSDVSPYSNCTASSLSPDFKLHIPMITAEEIRSAVFSGEIIEEY